MEKELVFFISNVLEIRNRNYGLIALSWGTFACLMSLNPHQDSEVIQHLSGHGEFLRYNNGLILDLCRKS